MSEFLTILKSVLYENSLLSIFLVSIILISSVFIARLLAKINADSFAIYTSIPALIKKMRMLGFLTLLIIPIVAFYESEFLKLYQANWYSVGFVCTISLCLIAFSFVKNLRTSVINSVISVFYTLLVAVVYFRAFETELNSTLVAESAVLLLFSKIIFDKLKKILFFFTGVYVYVIVLIYSFSAFEFEGFTTLISSLLLSTIVTMSMIIVESSSISNRSFSSKVLKYSDLLVLVSDIGGNIVYVSKPLRDLIKIEEDRILNKGWWKETRAGKYNLEEIVADLKSTSKNGFKPKYHTQLNVANVTYDIEWSDFALEKKFVMSIGKDVTEDLIKSKKLRRLSFVAENTENAVIILNLNLEIEWTNDAFTDIFGYTFAEVKGKNPGDFLNGPKTSSETLKRMREKLGKNEHVEEEILNYDKFGNEKWILVSMDPIFNEDKEVINYVAVENDITERKLKDDLIKFQHESIIDSLNYSSVIQKATLPTMKEIEIVNKDVFVCHHPKEIIGGDFYMVETLINDYGNTLEVYIVADCTGHGVPGAMLSVLCTNILKNAIQNKENHNPAQILDFTRKKLIDIFRTNKDYTINDGMDMSICVVDKSTGFLDYCGANRPLLIVKNDEVEVIKGNKQSVGFGNRMTEFTFDRIPFEKGDTVYLFSDGVVDQFGGLNDKKFLTLRLKNLLKVIVHLEMEHQCATINSVLDNWRGNKEQTDDICLMGIRL